MKSAGLICSLLLVTSPAALRADEPKVTSTEPAEATPTEAPAASTPVAAPTVDPAPAPAPVLAADPKTPVPPKISPAVTSQLTPVLPKYEPQPEVKPAPAPNPDVLVLPKMTVTQKKRPRLGEDVMMTSAAFNNLQAKERLSSFDRNFLNRYALPDWFGGVSVANRAREEYDRAKKAELQGDVDQIARATSVTDPAEAKALHDAAGKP